MQRHIYIISDNYTNALESLSAAIGDKLSSAGGYYARVEAGEYTLMPAAAIASPEDYEGEEYMTQSPLWHDTEVFRQLGVRLLGEAEFYPFAVLAPIGGFELIVPQFRTALSKLISSDLPTVGILYSAEETERIRALLGLGDKLTAYSQRVRTALEEDGDSIIIPEEKSEETIKAWSDAFML